MAALISGQLDFVLDFLVNGEQTGPLTFTFTFTHDETPNDLDPCPYPTDPGDGSGTNLMDLASCEWWQPAVGSTAPGLAAGRSRTCCCGRRSGAADRAGRVA